jgi:glutamyl/glutaminyl-tRNA synthetase
MGGRVILRIEDHDRQRSRPEWERQLLDDLDWLGFVPDVYPTDAYRQGPCSGRQSERDEIYRQALAPLIAQGLVYGCRCTRAAQAAVTEGAPPPATGERPYAGTCRHAGIELTDDVGWRLTLDPGLEVFDDGLLGRQEQDPSAQCGDLLLRDRLGNWTYQCVAAIDDTVQGVTLVVRGQDLLVSSGRQIRLARLIGRRKPATFVHHSLVMKSPTQKLSKSDGDTGIASLRATGWSPEQIVARAVSLAGLGAVGSMPATELANLFSDDGREDGLLTPPITDRTTGD